MSVFSQLIDHHALHQRTSPDNGQPPCHKPPEIQTWLAKRMRMHFTPTSASCPARASDILTKGAITSIWRTTPVPSQPIRCTHLPHPMPLHTTSPRILKQTHTLNALHKIPDPGKAKPERFDAGLAIALATQEAAEHGDLPDDFTNGRWLTRRFFFRPNVRPLPLCLGKQRTGAPVWRSAQSANPRPYAGGGFIGKSLREFDQAMIQARIAQLRSCKFFCCPCHRGLSRLKMNQAGKRYIRLNFSSIAGMGAGFKSLVQVGPMRFEHPRQPGRSAGVHGLATFLPDAGQHFRASTRGWISDPTKYRHTDAPTAPLASMPSPAPARRACRRGRSRRRSPGCWPCAWRRRWCTGAPAVAGTGRRARGLRGGLAALCENPGALRLPGPWRRTRRWARRR